MNKEQFQTIQEGDILTDRGGNLFCAAQVIRARQHADQNTETMTTHLVVVPAIDAETAQHWNLVPKPLDVIPGRPTEILTGEPAEPAKVPQEGEQSSQS